MQVEKLFVLLYIGLYNRLDKISHIGKKRGKHMLPLDLTFTKLMQKSQLFVRGISL
jgi:hypothetical protein